jgi:hypothetical protein
MRGGRTKGQTEMTKLVVAFRNFAKAPKNTKLKQVISKKHCSIHKYKYFTDAFSHYVCVHVYMKLSSDTPDVNCYHLPEGVPQIFPYLPDFTNA